MQANKRVTKKERMRKGRRTMIKGSIFSAIKESLGTKYIQPFAIAINASNSLVALLISIQGLLGPMSQMAGARMMEKYERKKIVTKSVLFESLIWLLFAAIAILFYKGIIPSALPIIVLFSFGVFTIVFSISHPPWFSWIGDLVDKEYRGRWFSKKSLLRGSVGIVVAIIAAIFLDYAGKDGWAMIGFAIVFTLAFLARIIGFVVYSKGYDPDPKFRIKKRDQIRFMDFVLNAPKNNFGKFSIYRAFVSFSAAVTTPLLAVYLLRTLQFSYFIYMVITLSVVAASLILLRVWGKFIDKYGNYRVLIITSIIFPIEAILWILNPSPIYLILVPALLSGIMSSGFLLASDNFIFDSIKKEKRGTIVSYFNMLRGIGIFLGAGLGAILIRYVNTTTIEPIVVVFITGAILRMIVVFFGLNTIREIRKTKKILNMKNLKKALVDEVPETLEEEAHQILSIKDYLE
jgi:MFS family permease